jgi:hypothetical protein
VLVRGGEVVTCAVCGRDRGDSEESGWYRWQGEERCPLHPPHGEQLLMFEGGEK